jgi:hypothetical protein
MNLKPNFTYPRIGAKIRIIGDGFNADRYGYYLEKTETGQLVLDMDPNNIFPPDRKKEIINVWDNFEVI